MVHHASRSSLSSKSLAASICITYASTATVYYTIGIYLVGLMTGTKGDDAAEARSGSPALRFAFLSFLSFFRRLLREIFRSRATLLAYISSRSDEIRGRTNIVERFEKNWSFLESCETSDKVTDGGT